MEQFSDIENYISAQADKTVQQKLQRIRETIAKAAPEAKELISYSMPAFKQHGMLVYFAAFKNHISFFPAGSGVEAFKEKLLDYKTSKGTIQFSFSQEIPYELIEEIVKFRVLEDKEKVAMKALRKKNK